MTSLPSASESLKPLKGYFHVTVHGADFLLSRSRFAPLRRSEIRFKEVSAPVGTAGQLSSLELPAGKDHSG